MGIGPTTKLSELRKIAQTSLPPTKPSMLAISIAQSMRVEGYYVTEDEVESLIFGHRDRLPDYAGAQMESKASGKDVMFRQGTTIGVIRYHQGNWYWVNVERLKK